MSDHDFLLFIIWYLIAKDIVPLVLDLAIKPLWDKWDNRRSQEQP